MDKHTATFCTLLLLLFSVFYSDGTNILFSFNVFYVHIFVIIIAVVITIIVITVLTVIVIATIIVNDIITVISMCDLLLLHPEKSRIGMAVFTLHVLHLCRLFRAGPDVSNPTTPLSYRDVFVLTGDDSDLQDDVIGEAGQVTSPASGFVRGLWAEGVPVCVLEGSHRVGGRVGQNTRMGWESRVADVAVSRTNRVTVADWRSVQGLERRVVVWLTDVRGEDGPGGDPDHMLVAQTRCTTQLIIVSRC